MLLRQWDCGNLLFTCVWSSPGLPWHGWTGCSEEGRNNTGMFLDSRPHDGWMCLSVTRASVITQATHEYMQTCSYIYICTDKNKLITLSARQTDRRRPYGQDVVLRQISRALEADSGGSTRNVAESRQLEAELSLRRWAHWMGFSSG